MRLLGAKHSWIGTIADRIRLSQHSSIRDEKQTCDGSAQVCSAPSTLAPALLDTAEWALTWGRGKREVLIWKLSFEINYQHWCELSTYEETESLVFFKLKWMFRIKEIIVLRDKQRILTSRSHAGVSSGFATARNLVILERSFRVSLFTAAFMALILSASVTSPSLCSKNPRRPSSAARLISCCNTNPIPRGANTNLMSNTNLVRQGSIKPSYQWSNDATIEI